MKKESRDLVPRPGNHLLTSRVQAVCEARSPHRVEKTGDTQADSRDGHIQNETRRRTNILDEGHKLVAVPFPPGVGIQPDQAGGKFHRGASRRAATPATRLASFASARSIASPEGVMR